MPVVGHRGRRLSLLFTVLVASPLVAITLWSLGKTAMELTNPCITWGYPEGQPVYLQVGPNGPCREAGVHVGSRTSAVLLAVFVPGGVLLAAVLAVAAAASSRRKLMLAASIAMLLETPVVFTIAPLTLMAGLTFLFIAWRVGRVPGSPSIASGS